MAVVLIVGYYYINSTKDIYTIESANDNLIEESENKVSEEKEEKIIVHITGAIVKEGIVEVKENARINDVIEAAGGLMEDADIQNVNLAYQVEDGQKIYIPHKSDAEEGEDGEEIINNQAGENVLEEETEKTGKININNASETELETLPGIGNATAIKIITYRKENRKI